MPGETGSAHNGGSRENGGIPRHTTDDQSASTQSDPVNIVCPTCGHIPPEPQGLVKQYSGLSASGYSNNVFGDVQNQIVYCCSHCAPHTEHDTRSTSLRRTETGSSTASSPPPPPPVQVPSRTQTLEPLPSIGERMVLPVSHGTDTIARNGCEIAAVIGNSGGPGSADETASVSLIGLKSVQDPGNTDPHNWEKVYSTNAQSARLNIQDAHISEEKLRSNHEYPFIALARDWPPCTVSIEAHQQTGFRRLKIEEGDICEVWIPATRVQVSSNQRIVSMRFSNCNKLQPPGYYRTQNGAPMSVTTYHPEKPNVTFEVGFSGNDTVDDFCNHILHRSTPHNSPDDLYVQNSPQITISHRLHDEGSETEKPCIWIWKQFIDTENGSTVELHDIVAISGRLDFEVAVVDKEMDIVFGYMDRLTYYPAFDQPDLPQNVKRTLDGAPAEQNIEGGHKTSSRLCLTTKPTDATQLINHILLKTFSWKLESIFPRLDVKMSSSQRLKFGSNTFAAQLTLWSEPDSHMIRVLIRTSGVTDSDQKSASKETQWFSITLREGEGQPTAALKQNILTIKKVDCEDGNCVSTHDLRPVDYDHKSEAKNDSTGKGDSTNSIALELKFGSADQVQQFRETVTDRYLRLVDD